MPEQLRLLATNLQALGARRLWTLAGTFAVVLTLVAALSFQATRPTFETLYTGLERDDINRIGPVLGQAGIAYDVDAGGGTLLVEAGKTAQARMILAEQGLPRSQGAGYELFDQMGSLGLTSFMQEMTRMRALEGEISRSVRAIDGVRSARVHVMLPDRGSFSQRDRQATASVLLTTDLRMNAATASSIRHLVAAAVPQLSTDDVSVMDQTGRLLASGDSNENGGLGGLGRAETIEADLTQKITRMLEPRLGIDGFRVAVRAEMDTDELRQEETIYDPESRIERSVRVVRSQENDTEQTADRTTSVIEDLPEEAGSAGADNRTSRATERREETTNYEINSKTVATVRKGNRIKRLSASVVIDRARLDTLAGAPLDEAALEGRLDGIRRNVMAAAGFEADRDQLEIATDTFIAQPESGAADGEGWRDRLLAQAGTMVRSLALLIAILAVVLLGLRPVARMVLASSDAENATEGGANRAAEGLLAAPEGQPEGSLAQLQAHPDARERLMALADQDEARAADVLRGWLAEADLEPAAKATPLAA